MQYLDLREFSSSPIAIIAPHMDDEALACGGLIALLPNKENIHILYATDGMKSPAPIIAGRDEISNDLGKIRMQESINAMSLLGVPEKNLHFICLPEAELQSHISSLRERVREQLKRIAPQYVFAPFRYDRHPDHLAVNHVVVSDIEEGVLRTQLIEYFVYYRWRLMPKRDIRKYIKPESLFQLNIQDVASLKRKSLDCFTSQTTIYYPWQTRPILTPTLLDEESQNPEYFLIASTSLSGTAVFSGPVLWIRLAHRLEPILMRWKYLVGALLIRIFQKRVPNSD
jgi:LmbE family N-acetylglucosaminyl deacetylase